MDTKKTCFPRKIGSMSRKVSLFTLLAFALLLSPMVANGATVTLAWDANTESDLAGYKIYYGTNSRYTVSDAYSQSIDVGNTTQYTLADLDEGVTYYLAATAYDQDNNESDYSVELVHRTGNPNYTSTTIEAEDMPFTGSGNNVAVTDGWALLGEGYLSKTVDFTYSDVRLEVIAKGSYAGEGWPIMEVRIDGVALETVTIDSADWKMFEVFVDVTPGLHEVAFAFINDYYVAPNDRNLYIDKVTITVAGGNLPPEASIIVDGINGIAPLLVNFDGSGSHDPDGEIFRYDWDFGDDTIDSGDTVSHTFSDPGVYTARLTVTDDQGATDSDTIQITASSGSGGTGSHSTENLAPAADAGANQAVYLNDTVHLDGSSSSDVDGDALTFKWSFTSKPSGSTAALSNATAVNPVFVVDVAGSYIVQLIVNDGITNSQPDTVIISTENVPHSGGVPNDQDAFPNDPNDYLDTDGDGEGNNADTDDDNNEYDSETDPNYNESNFAPDPPQLLNPGNDETVGLTPLLETDEFYDSDIDDVHSRTQWKILRVHDEFCVFDVTTSSSLTALKVPKLILEDETDYIWQVKFFDNQGTASEWSETGNFTTEFFEQDSDGNGVLDHQEVDTTIDLDQDGIMDRDQEDIKCGATETGDFKICLSIREDENAESILSIQSETPDDTDLLLSAQDGPKFLAFGLIHFSLLVKEPGDEVLVTIYLSKAAYDDGIWYKYDSVNAEWVDYSEFIDFSADRKMVYLTLTDGGFGDADGIENGVIVDPLALRTATDHSSGSDNFVEDVVDNLDNFVEDVVDNLNPASSCFISAADPRSADRQPLSFWREIRSLELSIVFILMMLAYIGKEISLRIMRYRRIGRRTSLMEGWRDA